MISRLVVYKEAYDISRKGSHILTKNRKYKNSKQSPYTGYLYILYIIYTYLKF